MQTFSGMPWLYSGRSNCAVTPGVLHGWIKREQLKPSVLLIFLVCMPELVQKRPPDKNLSVVEWFFKHQAYPPRRQRMVSCLF